MVQADIQGRIDNHILKCPAKACKSHRFHLTSPLDAHTITFYCVECMKRGVTTFIHVPVEEETCFTQDSSSDF